MKLAEIVKKYGLSTDKTTGHSYGDFYDAEFARFRDRPISLLEIGVQFGESLRMWLEYFPDALRIYGVDKDTSRIWGTFPDNVVLVKADAYCSKTAEAFGRLDIIIDDGSHALIDQIKALRLYLPHLLPGGVLVVEDVQHPDWFPELSAVVPSGYGHEAINLRHVKQRSDDLLFVVRNENQE
jgi:predicted O-methyltransferase YrrM